MSKNIFFLRCENPITHWGQKRSRCDSKCLYPQEVESEAGRRRDEDEPDHIVTSICAV